MDCGLYLDNRVFILVSKQTITILTNQNRDEKTNLRKKIINYSFLPWLDSDWLIQFCLITDESENAVV